jgi:hypothetical protein
MTLIGAHAGAGGARSRAISDEISVKISATNSCVAGLNVSVGRAGAISATPFFRAG